MGWAGRWAGGHLRKEGASLRDGGEEGRHDRERRRKQLTLAALYLTASYSVLQLEYKEEMPLSPGWLASPPNRSKTNPKYDVQQRQNKGPPKRGQNRGDERYRRARLPSYFLPSCSFSYSSYFCLPHASTRRRPGFTQSTRRSMLRDIVCLLSGFTPSNSVFFAPCRPGNP